MDGTTVGRRGPLLASGAVLAGAGATGRAMEVLRGVEALCDCAEAFVLHPQGPEAPGLPPGPA